jgi:hypothetical protein
VPHCAVVFQSYAGYEEEIVLFPSSRPRAPLLQHLPALVRESPRPLPSLHQRSSACTSIPYEQAPLGALIQLTIGCVAAQPVAEEQHAIDLRAARREDMEIDVGVMFSLCEQVYLRYAQKGIFLPRFPQAGRCKSRPEAGVQRAAALCRSARCPRYPPSFAPPVECGFIQHVRQKSTFQSPCPARVPYRQ